MSIDIADENEKQLNEDDNEKSFLLLESNDVSESYNATSDNKQEKVINRIGYSRKCDEKDESISEICCDEFNKMIKLSLPVIVTNLFEILPGVVSIVLVGHVHSYSTREYLDAAALGTMFLNLIGVSIGKGLASAMDTLCSQAYGANESRKMGTFLQTGLIVLSVNFIFVFFVSLYAAEILIALGQPVRISRLAGSFLLHQLPGIPFMYMYELLRRIMQSQNIALPMLYASISANIVNISLGYYLVFGGGSSWWLGASVARGVSQISSFFFMIVYLYTSNYIKLFWSEWNLSAAIKGIPEFLSLAIPGAMQLCFEWWAFICLSLISGLLPDSQLSIGANAILLNIESVVYMCYLGNSISCNMRIGNALGAGLPNRARVAANLALGIAFAMSLLMATLLIMNRLALPLLFTQDNQIRDYCTALLYIVAIYQLPDSINATVQGIFRASGRQAIGAKLNFFAYYIVGIPFGIILAFYYHQGLRGLWIGLSTGLCFVTIIGAYITLCRSDWEQLAIDAKQRMKR